MPPRHVFLLGDNRPNSRDSRHHGPVPEERVFGRVLVVWYATTASGTPDGERIGVPVR